MRSDMKRLIVAAIAVFLPLTAFADPAELRPFVEKMLVRCADQKIDIQRIPEQGPLGFIPYGVTQTSSDETCGRQAFLLYSPMSQQVILGSVFPVPVDNRPLNMRVSEQASKLLKKPIDATVSGFPLPDGLHAVSMTKDTPFGPFSYHGWIDSSQRYLIVGERANLRTDPAKTLVESLGLEHGVRRGNPASKTQIIELSDFECPTCARAHKKVEPMIEKALGHIDYIRLDLPLFEHHEWAIPAALGGRAIAKVAPKEYWKYVNFVFENQETIGKQNFDVFFKNYCEDHDINWKAIDKIYRSPAERQSLLAQVSRAFDNGIVSTPTYIINGRIMGYGPEGSFTIDAIKAAIGTK